MCLSPILWATGADFSGGGLREPSPVPFCTGQLEQTSDECYGDSVESSCFSSPGILVLPFPLHRRHMGKPGSTFMPSLLLHRRRWTGPKAEVGSFFLPLHTQCLLCACAEQGNVGVIAGWYACESCSFMFLWSHKWNIQIMVVKCLKTTNCLMASSRLTFYWDMSIHRFDDTSSGVCFLCMGSIIELQYLFSMPWTDHAVTEYYGYSRELDFTLCPVS